MDDTSAKPLKLRRPTARASHKSFMTCDKAAMRRHNILAVPFGTAFFLVLAFLWLASKIEICSIFDAFFGAFFSLKHRKNVYIRISMPGCPIFCQILHRKLGKERI